jgi:hypothetical protein
MLPPLFGIGQPFFELFSLKRSPIVSLLGKSSLRAALYFPRNCARNADQVTEKTLFRMFSNSGARVCQAQPSKEIPPRK